jgi:hypothetical protein
MAYIGKEPIVGNFQKCDAITVVNGQAAYTLQVSSTNVVPESANHMLVSLNGILQAPVTSFTVSGSTLTFASNLATGDVIDFVILLGNVLDLGTVSDGTITAAKVANDLISGKTALATAPADTDEFLVSDAGTLKRLDYSLIKAGNTPAFEAYLSADTGQLSDNTATKVTFGSEVYDSNSTYDTSNGRFTPAVAGKYFIYGNIGIDDTAQDNADEYEIQIYKNGSVYTKFFTLGTIDANGVSLMGYSAAMDLDDDDYVEIYVRISNNDGSAARKVNGDSGTGSRSTFGAFKIG